MNIISVHEEGRESTWKRKAGSEVMAHMNRIS